jgi:hypothetical protein
VAGAARPSQWSLTSTRHRYVIPAVPKRAAPTVPVWTAPCGGRQRDPERGRGRFPWTVGRTTGHARAAEHVLAAGPAMSKRNDRDAAEHHRRLRHARSGRGRRPHPRPSRISDPAGLEPGPRSDHRLMTGSSIWLDPCGATMPKSTTGADQRCPNGRWPRRLRPACLRDERLIVTRRGAAATSVDVPTALLLPTTDACRRTQAVAISNPWSIHSAGVTSERPEPSSEWRGGTGYRWTSSNCSCSPWPYWSSSV